MKRRCAFSWLACGWMLTVMAVRPPGVLAETDEDISRISSVAAANNRMALDLYRQLKADENIFFSPHSIHAALAMAHEGARGKTAEEMARVLCLPADGEAIRAGFDQLRKQLHRDLKQSTLVSANALWAQKDFPFTRAFLIAIERYYHGKAANLDFRNAAEEARKTINGWVKSNTRGRIAELIPPGIIHALTRLVITNAVCFKGRWELPFAKNATREADFHVDRDTAVKVPMMRLMGKSFAYAETGDLQLLEMPYAGGDLSALILLPRNDGLARAEKAMDLETLDLWRTQLRKTEIDLFLPRFKLETKYFLAENLGRMGMTLAFSGSADFSAMTGAKNLFISEVIHQAFVEVSEEGTEAAAATAVVMKRGLSADQNRPVFRADRPFLFLIRDTGSDAILFLGKVMRPA